MTDKNTKKDKSEEKRQYFIIQKISQIVTVVIFSFVSTLAVMYFVLHILNKVIDSRVQIARNEIIAEVNEALVGRDKNYSSDQKIRNSNVHVVDKRFDNLQKQINDILKQRDKDVVHGNATQADIYKELDSIWERYNEDAKVYNNNQEAFEFRLRTLDDEQNSLASSAVQIRSDVDFQNFLLEQHGTKLQGLLTYRHWLESKFFGTLAMPKD